jgi:GNAT superfamily N-acetyltransferase
VTAGFAIEALRGDHDRVGFSCGAAALDRYFSEQVTQDIRRRATGCYVAVESTTRCVAGYYTLAASGIPLAELPEALAKRLPRYPVVPVARLGRLAIHQAYQRRQLGAALLWDAAARAARSEVVVFGMVVDAKDTAAERFYLHHGFVGFVSLPRQLIFPLARLRA